MGEDVALRVAAGLLCLTGLGFRLLWGFALPIPPIFAVSRTVLLLGWWRGLG